ncbi:DUF4132 domain-containing protein [Thermopolyspora sp. NPDC052614]|uniref:DUF4132 domain-containing protein n=1 Tax=Thermopolyspora sp. NPDC052614 TaxID=3155682 RepID=UPI0034429D1E
MEAPKNPGRSGPPDEDILIIPNEWRRRMHPRRGGLPVSVRHERGFGVDALPATLRAQIEDVLKGPVSDPELARLGLARLRGEASPLGAAVVAMAAFACDGGREAAEGMVRGWPALDGLAFAACAFAELAAITIRFDLPSPDAPRLQHGVVYAAPDESYNQLWWAENLARSLRALLAEGAERDYQEAVERLAEHRRTSLQRLVVSYLVPTRLDWVDECCANLDAYLSTMLFCALGSARHLELLGGRLIPQWSDCTPEALATLLEGVGVAAVPLLATALEQAHIGSEDRRNLLNALAVMPSDDAFRILLDQIGERFAQPPLLAATRRFPMRALRLLAQAADAGSKDAGSKKYALVTELLGAHVRTHPELTEAALPTLPDAARAAIESIRAANAARLPDAPAETLRPDPLENLPAKKPVIGSWVDPVLLPQVALRDRAHALPVAAAGHLLTMLALSKPGQVHPGVDAVRELCDPGSLAEFSWAVFEAWRAYGTPAKDVWALRQLGLFGDDDTVRRLAPVIRAWPGQDGHARAVIGLDVLAAIGTDVALMHLYGLAQKAPYKGLRARAQQKVEQVARKLGLTPEQFADRLVPDFGLDAGGGMVLDYGPRRFVVGFDEQLKPYVADEDGKRRASLPKPGAKDDPEPAAEAYKRFAALKKDVRAAAADQIRRLESAMLEQRRWTVPEFETYLAGHPLLRHITRRLVSRA